MCVLTHSINASILNPPDAVLNQISRHMPVLLIQIRHASTKPSVKECFLLCLRSMRIHHRPFQMTSRLEFSIIIEPVFCWHILQPPMSTATMVENHVHHHLHAHTMCLIYQFTVFLIRAESGVNLVIVCSGVAMIRPSWLSVFKYGIEPYSCEPEVLNIVQMIDNASHIATVTCPAAGSIHLDVIEFIIRRVSIGKSVWSDEVDGICSRNALRHLPFFSGSKLIRHSQFVFAFCKYNIHLACLGNVRNVQIQEKIIWVVCLYRFFQINAWILDRNVGVSNTFTMHHQLEFMVLHAYPPVCRFHSFHPDTECGGTN